MSESPWSNEVWITTEAAAAPPTGGEYAGMTPTRLVNSTSGLLNAMATAVAGDVIGVDPGTYIGIQQPGYEDELYHAPGWLPANSGTANSPITFVAKYPAALTTNASQYTDLRSGGPQSGEVGHYVRTGWPVFGSIYNKSRDYIHWVGFYSDESDTDNAMAENSGMGNFWNCTGCQVRLCRLLGDVGKAAQVGNNYSALRLEYNLFDFTASDNIFANFLGDNNANGWTLYGTVNVTLEYNTVYNCREGMYVKGVNNGVGNEGVTIRNNLIYDCGWAGLFLTTGADNFSAATSRIHNNLFRDCDQGWDMHQAAADGYNKVVNTDFYNNTLANCGPGDGDGTIRWQNPRSAASNNSIYNNIIYNGTYAHGSYFADATKVSTYWARELDYNCYNGLSPDVIHPSFSSWENWKSSLGLDNNTIQSDPDFVDEGNNDYRLNAGSPCRTSGKGGGAQGCYITGSETIGVR